MLSSVILSGLSIFTVYVLLLWIVGTDIPSYKKSSPKPVACSEISILYITVIWLYRACFSMLFDVLSLSIFSSNITWLFLLLFSVNIDVSVILLLLSALFWLSLSLFNTLFSLLSATLFTVLLTITFSLTPFPVISLKLLSL